ncbi:lipid A deacylase LpxR family protein [Deminuibacter soli]|uniref:Lipid A deacylase LpxR family protein n=1 Tax=Deminuibacter soli TaxID=2291815 RepID=A0A3E1NR19_9BACT|nr:lipid A deacylase LpxR family protein [Deminuibacter soli]RFM30350.1 lipid A deacylase LpxR family protein [Deminuibacter soli]
MNSRPGYVTALLFFLFSFAATAQQEQPVAYRHQFTLTSDNDFYLALYNDRYYTEGLFFNYSWAGRDTLQKKLYAVELGQLMYNPYDYLKAGTAAIDRPYAGYLYLSLKQTRFLANDQVLQFGVSAGITGKPSLAEALQKWYHHLVGFKRPTGWAYQITAEPSLNLHALYAATLHTHDIHFAIKPVAEINLGNAFSNAQAGLILQWGVFENNSESALWNAGISSTPRHTRNPHEFFVYLHPQLNINAYNATIQGGLFTTNKGYTTPLSVVQPVVTLGAMYARNRFTFGAAAVLQGRETRTQREVQEYGSLQIGYRFN